MPAATVCVPLSLSLSPFHRARELVRQQEQIASLQQELEDTKERMHRDALDYAAANAGTGRNDGAAASGGVALRGSGGKVWQPLSPATAGELLTKPPTMQFGGTEPYPTSLHPESSAHTKVPSPFPLIHRAGLLAYSPTLTPIPPILQRLVDAAVADAVATAATEWEHERSQLLGMIAEVRCCCEALLYPLWLSTGTALTHTHVAPPPPPPRQRDRQVHRMARATAQVALQAGDRRKQEAAKVLSTHTQQPHGCSGPSQQVV